MDPSKPSGSAATCGKASSPSTERFIAAMKQLTVDSPDALTDVVIESTTTEYKVHGIILSMHSGYFKRDLERKGYHEGTKFRHVDLKKEPGVAVNMMMQYIYRFDYKVVGSDENSHHCLIAHSAVFALADKYNMPALKDLAMAKFNKATALAPPDALFQQLRSSNGATALVKAVPHVYKHSPSNDKRLRRLTIERLLAEDMQLLKCCPKPVFDATVMEVPEFACDLFPRAFGSHATEPKKD